MLPESPWDVQSEQGPVLTSRDQWLSLNIKSCCLALKIIPKVTFIMFGRIWFVFLSVCGYGWLSVRELYLNSSREGDFGTFLGCFGDFLVTVTPAWLPARDGDGPHGPGHDRS